MPLPTIMRAPGEAPGMFALESAMDEMAIACGLDPIELRIRNEPPTHPQSGLPFSSRNLVACLREGARRFGWEQRDPTPGPGGRRAGWWAPGWPPRPTAEPGSCLLAASRANGSTIGQTCRSSPPASAAQRRNELNYSGAPALSDAVASRSQTRSAVSR